MPPNRTVAVELKALVNSYVAGMRQATQATKQFATSAAKDINASKQQLDDLSSKGLVAGGALIAGVGLLVKTYADFDRQMSAIAATGDDARNNLTSLGAAALKAGKDTAFSASEAAAGVENLLKAGVTAEDVLSGGLIGSLNLAAAGELSVADAAETAAMALTQFHLKGSDVTHVADLLAAGAGKAQGEVSDLAMALRQSGLVANQFGLSVDDTVGTLAAFANAGLLGSDAGTSFKSMLLQLAGPSGTASKLMRELGINAYDAQGSFVGVTGLAGELQDKLGGLTQAQRNQALAVIFGTDAMRAASVMYDLGAAGLQKVIDQTNDAGYAARTAAIRMDNLAGDWEKFTGSIETAALQSGSGLNSWLRSLTQDAEGFADALGSVPAPLLDTVVKLAALTGGGLVAGSMLVKLGTNAASAWDSFQTLRAESPRLASGIGKVSKAAGVLAIALAALQVASLFGSSWQAEADKTKLSLADTAEALGNLSRFGSTEKLDEAFLRINGGATDAAQSILLLDRTSKDAVGNFLGQADSWIKGLFGVQGSYAANVEQIGKLDQALSSMDPTVAAAAFAKLSDTLRSYGMSQEDIVAQFPDYKATLVDTVNQLQAGEVSAEEYADWMGGKVPDAVKVATAAHPDLVEKLSDTQKAAAGGAQSMEDYAKSVWAAANAVLETSGSQIGFERALDDTSTAVDKLVAAQKKAGKYKDLTNPDTEAGRKGLEQLNQLSTATAAYTSNLIKNGGTQDEVRLAVARARKEFIDEAKSMGYSTEEAEALADARGLIPKNIKLETTEEGTVAAKERLKDLKDAIKDLPKKAQTKVESEFEKSGVDAAYAALAKIDGKAADAWINSMLDRGGIDEWKKYKPETKKAYVDVFNRQRQGGPKLADGGLIEGLIQRFASGGTWGQPQVRPFQGAAGVNWGEQGSGPWEAFISGAPQKKDRSIAVWREVGHRLLGSFSAQDVVAGFADGGIAEPTWGGKALSYWQDQLHTPLQITQLKIEIRDLKKDLSEKYSKGKNKGQHKLKGLDRTEAIQKLAEAEAELDLALKAQKVNADKLGSIANRLASYEQQKDEQQASQEAAEKAAQQAQDAAERAAQQAADAAAQLASTSASNSASLMAQYMQGSSAQDLIANMAAGAQEITKFQNLLAGLQTAGLNASVTDWLMGKGTSAADLAQQILAGGQSTIDFLNTGVGQLRTAADALGAAQATGNYTPAPVLSAVTLPGYMQSGASGAAVGNTYHSVFQITQSDPYAVAVAVDQQFRYLT